MMIHEDQQNVRALCEVASFMDSGFQSFREQVRDLPAKKLTEASFYAGGAVALKLFEYLATSNYSRDELEFLFGMIVQEVEEYMHENHMQLEWEPHVPSRWQQ